MTKEQLNQNLGKDQIKLRHEADFTGHIELKAQLRYLTDFDHGADRRTSA